MAELPSGTVTFLLTDVEGSTVLWEEATEAMRHLPGGPPRFRIKDMDGAAASGWDREWYYHPPPL